MVAKPNSSNANSESVEVKQSFLSSAISDISTYIQLVDTKVSIIMAAVVAIIVGVFACYEPIWKVVSQVKPCSWVGVSLIIFTMLFVIDLSAFFVFGILTIRGHSSKIGYKSKWFLPQPTKEYSFDAFKVDIQSMNDDDIIENMAAELYKLNDINRQKHKTYKWALISFSVALLTSAMICVLLVLSLL